MTETEILREIVKSQETLIGYYNKRSSPHRRDKLNEAIEKEEAIIENLKLDLVPFERQKS